MVAPTDIQLIGTEVALRWEDGHESFIPFATLRAASPSAQVRGERDVFGTVYGGEAPRDYRGIDVTGWESTATQSVTHVGMLPIIVSTSGGGTVTPNLNGKILELGKQYTMTATPAAGNTEAQATGSSPARPT